jgi:tetratricopeptide (TPR) repeat protein
MRTSCKDRQIGRLIGLYEFGALDKEDQSAFLDHLIECEYCYEEVYSLQPIMTAFRNHRSAARSGELQQYSEIDHHSVVRKLSLVPKRIWMWRSVPVAALLLLTLIAGGLVLYRYLRSPEAVKLVAGVAPRPESSGPNASRWEKIDVPKAEYTQRTDGVTLRGPNMGFDRAMASYEQNDFAGAIEQLETLSELEPSEGEVNFYLGVSMLLVGRNQDAITPLKRSVKSIDGALHETSHYYLALAYLKTNQPEQATAELDAVIKMNGTYRPAAKKLKQMLDMSK